MNLITFYGLRRLLNSFIKKYGFNFVTSLYECSRPFKVERKSYNGTIMPFSDVT